MCEQRVLIIGEVFVDTHLDMTRDEDPLCRLGGIFHSARAFSALGVEYALAYYAPSYLDKVINKWCCLLSAERCIKIGTIEGAPNVMLVKESKEAGNQGYRNILRKEAKYCDIVNLASSIERINPTDILVYPGRYDSADLLDSINAFEGKVHIDFHYDSKAIMEGIRRRVDTAILSTSSEHFKNQCEGSWDGIIEYFKSFDIERFLLKENRGGSSCFDRDSGIQFEAPAYHTNIMHSVGIGDVYNSVFISRIADANIENRMRLAAFVASKYAETMSFERFRENAVPALKNIVGYTALDGVRLSWEERGQSNIYLSAPDFPSIDIGPLEELNDCLIYHNFRTHLPIRENGLASDSFSEEEQLSLFFKDIELLDSCDLLIAVLLYNDPGTLVELGMFKHSGKPTIVYDPFGYCNNLFLKYTPDYLCKSLEEVVKSTYLCLRRR